MQSSSSGSPESANQLPSELQDKILYGERRPPNSKGVKTVIIFQQLDEYLNKEFSPDLWSDHAVIYAIDLVQKMTSADWDSLKSCWRYRSQEWQYRCAEIISDADSQQVIPLLLEMLQTPDDRLTIIAIDSLRSIGITEQNIYLSQDVLKRLQILSKNSLITQIIVNELLKQLQVRL